MVEVTRRQTLALGAGAFLTELLAAGAVRAAGKDTLTIAYNVNLPSFDPTDGPSAVNPTIQAIYRSIFDQYIGQAPDLTLKPGILTAWGWNDDKTKLWMDVRPDVKWQDGSPLTPEDVVWSLERAGAKDSANPISFIWSTAGNYRIDGNRINADAIRFEPTFFMWMAFLTGYVLPKAYYEKVGAEGFEKKPIGSGPIWSTNIQGNAFLQAQGQSALLGRKPAFETVIFKFVPDATTRVAEIESGSSDITLEVPYEEFDRLKKVKGLAGVATPISDIGMIFITNKEPMLDKNVRLARDHGDRQEGDRRPAVARLWRADRDARGARIFRLRPLDQDALRSQEGDRVARRLGLLA